MKAQAWLGRSSSTLIITALGALATCVLLPRVAAAEEAPAADAAKASAKASFEEGRKAMAEGNHEAACGHFAKSYELGKGVGAKFNLADCEEQRGKLARARQLFSEVVVQAREAGQADREAMARERLAAVEAKLSRLEIEVADPAATLTFDGQPLAREALAEPVFVEPGTHQLVASAPEKQDFTKEVEVSGPKQLLLVNIPALNAVAVEPAAESPEEAPPPTEDANRGQLQRRAAIVVGAVGVGFVVTGVAASWAFLANNHDAKGVCPSTRECTEEELASHDQYVHDAERARTWTYVGIGVGAAALGGAAALYFTAPRAKVQATTGFAPDGSWRVGLRGRF